MANEEVGNLKATLDLDGTGFQSGISKVSSQLKVVQSELQATSAKLALFGSNTDQLSAKAASLTKQLDLQSQKVSILQQAVAKSAAEKGEDARQTDLLTIKLNNALATQYKMQAQLEATNQALEQSATETDAFAQTMDALQRQMNLVQSQFRLATAEFSDAGSQAEKLSTQITSLNQQIDVQSSIVSELAAAHAGVAQAEGTDSQAAQELAIRLNDAKTALAGLQGELHTSEDNLKQLQSGLASTSDRATATEGAFSSLGRTIKSAIVFTGVYGGLYEVSSAFKNVITSGIQFDAQMQNSQIAFTTLLGSAQKAQTMLQQLAQFAQNTPFTITGVEQSATQMLAMGFDAQQILPDMKAIGDAAAAVGLQTDGIQRLSLALGQLRTHGTADAQDLDQITAAGIPAWNMLAQSIGKSVPQLRDMVQNGLVPAKQASDALIADMEEKYPNMLQKMNTSFTSEMGNMSDGLNQTFGKILQPTFNWLTTTELPKLEDQVNTFLQTLKQTNSLSDAMKTIFPASLVDDIETATTDVEKLFNFIKQNAPAIEALLAGMAAYKITNAFANVSRISTYMSALKQAAEAESELTKAQVAYNLAMEQSGIAAFISKIKDLRQADQDLTVAQAALDAAMDANPIGVITLGIAALVAAAYGLYKAWTNDWGGIQEKTEIVITAIKNGFEIFIDDLIADFDDLKSGVLMIVEGLMNAVSPVIDLIGKIAPGFESGFQKADAAVKKMADGSLADAQKRLEDATHQADLLGAKIAIIGSSKNQPEVAPSTPPVPPAGGSSGSQSASESAQQAADAASKALREATKNAQSQAKSDGQDIVQSFIDGLNNQLAPLQQAIDQLQAKAQLFTDEGNTKGLDATDNQLITAYQNQMNGLKSAMASLNAEMSKTTNSGDLANLKSQYSQLAVEWTNDQDAIVKLKQGMDSASATVTNLINAADSKETPFDNTISALQAQIQYLGDAGKSTTAATKQISAAYQGEIKSIESSISDLNAEKAKLNPKSDADLIAQITSKVSDLTTKLYNTKDALAQVQQQASQSLANKVTNLINSADAALQPVQSKISVLQAQIQYLSDAGKSTSEQNSELAQEYQQEIKSIQSSISSLNAEKAKLDPKTDATLIAQLNQEIANLTASLYGTKDALAQVQAQASQSLSTKITNMINAAQSALQPFQSQVSVLQAAIQYLGDAGKSTSAENAELAQTYEQEIQTIESRIKSLTNEMNSLNPKTQASLISQIKSELDDLNQSLYQTGDALQQLQSQSWQNAANAFQSISSQDITSINTALQNELTAMQQEHQETLDQFDAVTQAMDNQYDAQVTAIQNQQAAADAAIQAQISALQQQSTDDDRANQESQWNSQMSDLQHQLAVANLMGDTSTIDQVQQQIDQLNQQIAQQQEDWNIQDQTAALQAQQQQIDSQYQTQQTELQNQKTAYDNQRAAQRTALDQQLTDLENAKQQEITLEESKFSALQTALVNAISTGQLTQAQANAAWLQAIKDTGDQQLQLQIQADQASQDQLNSWVSQYVSIGQSYGNGLGQGLVDGLNNMLGQVQSAAARLASAAAAAMNTGQAVTTNVPSPTQLVYGGTRVVPALASGGILTRPTYALIGEAGPEAALPLNDSTMSRLATAITAQMPKGGGSSQPINIYMDSQLIGAYVWDSAAGQLQTASRKGVK